MEMTQPRVALARANEIRFARLKLKQRIAAGDVRVGDVLLDTPPEAQTWEVGDLLVAQPRWGPVRARMFLNGTYIGETKQVCSLTQRQRELLVDMLARMEEQAA